MKKHIYTFLILCLCVVPLFAQSDLEKELLSKIQEIDATVFDAKKRTMSIQPMLKSYQKLSKQVKKDKQLGAIINAKIGQALTKKNYHQDATPFLIKAYKYRKEQGEYFPQRWALKALINNGLYREDFKFAFKYSKEWVRVTRTDYLKLQKVYDNDYTSNYNFSEDLRKSVERIHPIEFYRGYKNADTNWEERRKYAYKFLEFTFKEFSDDSERVAFQAIGFYTGLYPILIKENQIDAALYWKDKSLKLIKKYNEPEYYAEYLRHLATWFRKEGKQMEFYGDYSFEVETNGMKNTQYEKIGIELIEEYIQVSKDISKKDQVLFGY